jgi:hypothetical protein
MMESAALFSPVLGAALRVRLISPHARWRARPSAFMGAGGGARLSFGGLMRGSQRAVGGVGGYQEAESRTLPSLRLLRDLAKGQNHAG